MEIEHAGLIRYTLEKVGAKDLKFQILDQNEKTISDHGGSVGDIGRVAGLNETEFQARSSYCPDLDLHAVWLRGSEPSKWELVITRTFTNGNERDRIFELIQEAILAWARLDKFVGLRQGYPTLPSKYEPKQEQLSLWD